MAARKTGTPPRWLKPMNRVLMAVQRTGLGMRELPVLTVTGRRTGEPRRTPVSVLHLDGERYLLCGYPRADWGRNARAAGRGRLAVNGVDEPVRLVELGAAESRPVLRAWPEQIPQGAKIMYDAGVVEAMTPEAFEKIAGVCAVFRLEPDTPDPGTAEPDAREPGTGEPDTGEKTGR